jgi:hypothetical protein
LKTEFFSVNFTTDFTDYTDVFFRAFFPIRAICEIRGCSLFLFSAFLISPFAVGNHFCTISAPFSAVSVYETLANTGFPIRNCTMAPTGVEGGGWRGCDFGLWTFSHRLTGGSRVFTGDLTGRIFKTH